MPELEDKIEGASGPHAPAAAESPDARDACAEARDENFVPAWLAALVLVLLLVVMAVGGYVLRGVLAGERRVATPEQREIQRWAAEVREKPTDLEARVQLGYAYQQAERFDRALSEYGYVLERDPRNTGALYNRGVTYLELGLSDKAEESLWDVLEVQRDHALAAKSLGEIYAKREQYRSLLAAVRPVVEAHPEMADLQYLTGLAYEHTGRLDWAKARYELALKYAPDMVEARRGLDRIKELE